jgi:hypothetical protein
VFIARVYAAHLRGAAMVLAPGFVVYAVILLLDL